MEKKHAVITGATQGIGRATAELFLQNGFAITVCARNAAELAIAKDMWARQYPGARISIHPADLSIRAEIDSFAGFAIKIGRADVLINNAGAFLQGDLATEPEGQLEGLMNVNLFSAYHLTRALLPGMEENKSGHIFNMCSVASLKAYPGGGAYSITKYALLGFSDNLREELKPLGIKVTAICPGATWSRSWSSSGVDESRIMEAADIAKMIWASYHLSAQANVETIVMRPASGDL